MVEDFEKDKFRETVIDSVERQAWKIAQRNESRGLTAVLDETVGSHGQREIHFQHGEHDIYRTRAVIRFSDENDFEGRAWLTVPGIPGSDARGSYEIEIARDGRVLPVEKWVAQLDDGVVDHYRSEEIQLFRREESFLGLVMGAVEAVGNEIVKQYFVKTGVGIKNELLTQDVYFPRTNENRLVGDRMDSVAKASVKFSNTNPGTARLILPGKRGNAGTGEEIMIAEKGFLKRTDDWAGPLKRLVEERYNAAGIEKLPEPDQAGSPHQKAGLDVKKLG